MGSRGLLNGGLGRVGNSLRLGYTWNNLEGVMEFGFRGEVIDFLVDEVGSHLTYEVPYP
jgi:hypothetical protein